MFKCKKCGFILAATGHDETLLLTSLVCPTSSDTDHDTLTVYDPNKEIYNNQKQS